MCGRYAVTLPPEAMRDLFRTLNQLDYPPRYNIAPTQPIVTVREEHGQRTMQLVRWGFVPNWVKDPRQFSLIINARIEGIEEKPSFRDAIKRQRCIVPASGYYEWLRAPDGTKQPYYVTMKDGGPMAFAGLFSTWAGPNGEEIDTAAIVTTPAGEDTVQIHDRSPAILRGEDIERWLDTANVSGKAAAQLVLPPVPGSVQAHPVGRAVGSNTAEGPELIVEVTPQTAPPVQKKKRAVSGQLDLF